MHLTASGAPVVSDVPVFRDAFSAGYALGKE